MPAIHQSLLISAPLSTIYAALTTSNGLSGWWTPDSQAAEEINSILHFPFGPSYFKEMKVSQLEPFELVKWNCVAGAEEWIGTNLSFELKSADDNNFLVAHPEMEGQMQQVTNGKAQSLLTFHHEDWKEYSPMFAECSYTWGQFLRSLKLFCETGEGIPWPNQHRTKY